MGEHTLFKNFVTVSAPTYARYDPPKSSPAYARTSASVVIVSELNASDDTFLGYGVGDLLHFKLAGPDGGTTTRRVAGVTDAPNAVSVNAAISIGTSGRMFAYQRWHNTTSADNDEGWFFCGDVEDKSILIVPTTITSTSISYVINGDIMGVSFTIVPATAILAAAAGTNVHIPITQNVRRLQVGLFQTGAGANDVSVFYRAKPKQARP